MLFYGSRLPLTYVNAARYVLRIYLAETAIRKAADERDYSEIDRLMRLLAHPYDEQAPMQVYADPAPQ